MRTMPLELRIGTQIFHGTKWRCPNDSFTELETSEEYDVAWVTREKNVAEKFQRERKSKKDVGVILEGKVVSTLKLFDLESDRFPVSLIPNWDEAYEEGEEIGWQEFMDQMELRDARELYKYVAEIGEEFDGVVTTGSVGNIVYEDIALFDPSKVSIRRAKLNDSDKFVKIDRAVEMFENTCKRKKINR